MGKESFGMSAIKIKEERGWRDDVNEAMKLKDLEEDMYYNRKKLKIYVKYVTTKITLPS